MLKKQETEGFELNFADQNLEIWPAAIHLSIEQAKQNFWPAVSYAESRSDLLRPEDRRAKTLSRGGGSEPSADAGAGDHVRSGVVAAPRQPIAPGRRPSVEIFH